MDETREEELRELNDLKNKVEGHEEYIKQQKFPYKFFVFLVFIGAMLGTIYLLGYWPDFIRFVELVVNSFIEAYGSVVSGAEKLQRV